MNPKLKITAYAVLLILCACFGWGFYSNYSVVTKIATDAPVPPPDISTNAATNETTATNIAAASTNAAASSATNAAITGATNSPPPLTNIAPPPTVPATAIASEGKKRSAMIGYLAALVGAVVGLGLLVAFDVSQLVGTQAVDFLFNDAGEGQRDPEYERAETEWANGKYLDAIQMMRDFLKKHPREIYAALRIAEIYEKDLRNYLAAALEYEEVLKHKLPAERWGWAAVHLCNLYSRINQSDKAVALLHRVADEYPKTAAAKKARARLGIAEPEPEPVTAQEAGAETEPETTGEQPIIYMEEHPPELEPRKEAQTPPPAAAPAPAPEPPKPSLPKGFRPKK